MKRDTFVEPQPGIGGDSAGSGGHRNILHVEDNEDDALYVHEVLSRLDFGQFWVRSTAEAWALLDIFSFDLILLDNDLPDTTGFLFLETLYKTHPEIPIIVLSGTDDTTVGFSAIMKGATFYLVKDGIRTDLAPTIAAVLAGR